MKKGILFTVFVALFVTVASSVVRAEELSVADVLSGWKLSGDMTFAATFKEPEGPGNSKLNFSYFQLYAEKQLQENLTLYLSLAVNSVSAGSDDYVTSVVADTAFLSYSVNDKISAHIGREIINYGYENPICIMDEKFVFLPAINSQYFGGYILRGDGVKFSLRNSFVDADVAYYNIPTTTSLQSKSLFARVSKTVGGLTAGLNALSADGPDKVTYGIDELIVYGPDVKYKNDVIEFTSELMMVKRKSDLGLGEETINRLGFYSQLTGNILDGGKLYIGGRFDYIEPFDLGLPKTITKYVSGVVGSYLYDNVMVRGQYKTNVDDGSDCEIGMSMTVSF